jgi:hypothetical protein
MLAGEKAMGEDECYTRCDECGLEFDKPSGDCICEDCSDQLEENEIEDLENEEIAGPFFPLVDLIEGQTDQTKIDRLMFLHALAEKGLFQRAYKLKDIEGDYLTGIWYSVEEVPRDRTDAYDIVSGIVTN